MGERGVSSAYSCYRMRNEQRPLPRKFPCKRWTGEITGLEARGQQAEVNGRNCGVSAKKFADERKGERSE